ncbi:cytochrome c biogenesis protein [Maribellus maritimus]|uniref:cytochrome c biogenesis protein n=1 Tax=Maribellus maritimus TaxID=2870838 RepID=UPI001EEC8705|nr:cytochrome c biogenesis protein CcsA [Maribellus maritimus]MCG6189250.1 cytochrome c biogenesis protein CcsA [Maribellus maritimus]
MKKFVSFLFSMLFTGILIVIFAVAIAYATFVENDFGTITAKILIYNSKWFEVLLIILCINIIGSAFKYKLFSKKKWTILLFHIAFVVIIIGAAITRYHGFEGMMHIREASSSNTIISDFAVIKILATNGNQVAETEKEVKFSPYTANRFSETIEIGGKKINVKNLLYVTSAMETVVIDPSGGPVVSVMAVGEGMQRTDFNLQEGNTKVLNGNKIGFNTPGPDVNVNFKIKDGKLFLLSTDSVSVSQMMQTDSENHAAGEEIEISTQNAYSAGNLTFAVKQFLMNGKTQLVYSQPQQGIPVTDALQIQVTAGGVSKDLIVYGKKGEVGELYSTNINGIDISVSYGSKIIEIPFSIYLEDFQLERYPGSNSPSSYASEVVLKDGSFEMPFRIYMNNILKYNGYRFFQSSYDTDEKGTVLSVNHDALGTGVTYLGYLIMALGMVLTLLNKNSRFKTLVQTSAKLREERKKLFAILILGFVFAFNTNAQSVANRELNDEHVSAFAELVVQSRQGRVEPVSTLASEILRKVAKKNSWEGMSPTEVFLDMQANPEKWKSEPVIKVANPELRRMLGATGKYVSFNMIVAPREMGGYKLSSMVSAAYAKSSNQRNKLDKEVMNVDERVNILMGVFSGDFLNIFPVPGHDNHKWVSLNHLDEMTEKDASFAQNTISAYLGAVKRSDWATANQLLENLKNNQQQFGSHILPAKTKINLEILYNNLNIFGKLSKIFMFTGLILLILQLITLFNPKIKFKSLRRIAVVFILLLFLAETAGLGIRWYISGHAPWSNGYESMIFISWATCLGGLIFANRSEITLSLTTVLSGLALMVAGMSWMSPEITNLVPVLKSYWLIVHVAIITSSYGFLGIGALLGLLNLILMIFRNKNNLARINFTIRELVNIIQITLMIGLLLLTVGSFLGGVWANESWGRYWGWDPKETWALVTVLVYTFIGHMHRIPGFKGNFTMSAAALLGISSVLMTYFGVNYYLSGLHSYAQGEAAPIPAGVYVAVAIVFVIIVAAYFSEKTSEQQTKN